MDPADLLWAQGSTNFSYFAWGVPGASGRAYKWGKALPIQCQDEAWPDGGVWDEAQQSFVYPNLPVSSLSPMDRRATRSHPGQR